jgi:hypothetical protein
MLLQGDHNLPGTNFFREKAHKKMMKKLLKALKNAEIVRCKG